ncbi:MAG: zf-TFIIB domain-containing protein [Pirellulales bacterium]|nr:zf-TFIIB domain-containing protein [Pirellulales bacterium]
MNEQKHQPPPELAEAAASADLAAPPTDNAPPDHAGPPNMRPCPVCGQPMATEQRSGVTVKACSRHGVWFENERFEELSGKGRQVGGSRWRPVAIGLCVAQILGISISVVAAAIEIETICATGPTFTILGVMVALGYRVSRSPSSLAFGLSAAVVTVACFVWINLFSWGPDDAQGPVTSALIGYELLVLPVGGVALYRTLRPLTSAPSRGDSHWQFGIGGLLATTAVLAVAMGVGRSVALYGRNVRVGIAAGLLVLATVSIGVAVARARRPAPGVH